MFAAAKRNLIIYITPSILFLILLVAQFPLELYQYRSVLIYNCHRYLGLGENQHHCNWYHIYLE